MRDIGLFLAGMNAAAALYMLIDGKRYAALFNLGMTLIILGVLPK